MCGETIVDNRIQGGFEPKCEETDNGLDMSRLKCSENRGVHFAGQVNFVVYSCSLLILLSTITPKSLMLLNSIGVSPE